jgi:hypothetical protein
MIMKFLNKNGRLTGIVILLLSLTGCKKFVEIDTPPTLLVASGVFNDNTTATQAQTNIYSQMSLNSESFNMSSNSGLLSDELTGYAAFGAQRQFYINAITANGYTGPWQSAYNYIYQANAVMEGLQKNSGVSTAVKKQLSGEAKFIRTFWHFYLTNCYGAVPLVTTTAYATNARLARTPQVLVYQQIIQDLKDAQGLLSNHYVDFSDTANTSERTRPTLWAADALLARVYLYTKKYDLAEAAATAVINHTDLYGLEPDLNSVFLANSREAIWQLQIPQPNNGVATQDGYNFILQADPTGSGGVSVSSQLLGSFEPGDHRRTNWVHDTTFAGTPYAYPYKYKQGMNNSTTVTEYVMVLRLAEQYLIRAEARANQGKLPEAIADLNAIRNRAGLGNYAGSTTDPAAVLGAILHERQVELFTEWGHRWFDLIRTGTVNSVMSVVTPLKGGTWPADGHQTLYPIAQTELGKDNNLTQNPGY